VDERLDPWLLWPRAILAGGLAFGFGVVGHVTADGLLPGPGLLVALLVLVVAVSAPVLNRAAGPIRIVSLLVGGQAVVHLALTVTAGHRGDPGLSSPVSPSTRHLAVLPQVDGHRMGSLQDAYEGMSSHSSTVAPALPVGHLAHDLAAHAPMMAVHLVAAALVGLWLARGERCLWTLLALTSRLVLAASWALAPVPAAPPRRLPALAPLSVIPVALRQSRPHARRGPPVLAA